MFVSILLLHISGGILSLVFAGRAIVAVIQKTEKLYKKLYGVIALVTAFEVITGVLVTALSKNGSVGKFCLQIGFYLLVMGTVEGVLFIKLKAFNKRLASETIYSE